ncbi:MAG: glutamate--tRNA ligase [bacterium]
MSSESIRVRIAPSPSGFLHVGTARTALFNYLFAKKHNGKFILRIEDTDLERSNEIYTQNIYDSLKAMGLNWDEGPDVGGPYGPYRQSECFDEYKSYAERLLSSGHAYYCYCTQEELDAEKESAIAEKRAYVYSGRCKHNSAEAIDQFKAEGRIPTIRFSVPSRIMKFKDIVRNEVEFDTNLLGDFVIMKSNGTPTYNFAVVVDDSKMKISHVVRGEDHISNTPRQLLIYEALGEPIPQFAHVGMILAPDRTKLSKRHGATAVSEFIEQGYLPEAFVNFLSLLGWSPADGEEVKPLNELVEAFSLERVSSSPAIFEFDKLNWMNGIYIRNFPISDITERCKKYLNDYDLSQYTDKQLESIIAAVREPLVKLSEVTDAVSYFFEEKMELAEEIKEILSTDEAKTVLSAFSKFCESLNYEDMDELHDKLAEFRKSITGLKPKQIMMPLRAGLTGRTKGADMGVVISVLGKDRIQKRIARILEA